MRILMSVSIGLMLAACTIQSDKLSTHDAIQHYVAPAVCQKQSECIPAVFATVYPNGVNQCVDTVVSKTKNGSDLSGCDNAQLQQCAADTKAAACPDDASRYGVPLLPDSCKGC